MNTKINNTKKAKLNTFFTVILFTLLFWMVAFISFATTPTTIKGIWLNDTQKVKVRMVEENGIYKGIVIWKAEDASDELAEGDAMVKDLKPTGTGSELEGGTIGSEKRNARCAMRLIDANNLEVTMSKGFFSKMVTWTRVQE